MLEHPRHTNGYICSQSWRRYEAEARKACHRTEKINADTMATLDSQMAQTRRDNVKLVRITVRRPNQHYETRPILQCCPVPCHRLCRAACSRFIHPSQENEAAAEQSLRVRSPCLQMIGVIECNVWQHLQLQCGMWPNSKPSLSVNELSLSLRLLSRSWSVACGTLR